MNAPKRGILFQEYLKAEPFWLLVACQLVNLTTFDQAEPALKWLMSRYDVYTLGCASEEDLHAVLKPLGLWRRRSRTLIAFAHRRRTMEPRTRQDVLKLPGCGKYAADSWAIFIENDYCVKPDDGKLNWYLANMKEKRHG